MTDSPEQFDAMHDRLMDSALRELLAEESPPDLSRQILAASQHVGATREVVSRPKQRGSAPRLWFLGITAAACFAMVVRWGIPSRPLGSHAPAVVALADNARGSSEEQPATAESPTEFRNQKRAETGGADEWLRKQVLPKSTAADGVDAVTVVGALEATPPGAERARAADGERSDRYEYTAPSTWATDEVRLYDGRPMQGVWSNDRSAVPNHQGAGELADKQRGYFDMSSSDTSSTATPDNSVAWDAAGPRFDNAVGNAGSRQSGQSVAPGGMPGGAGYGGAGYGGAGYGGAGYGGAGYGGAGYGGAATPESAGRRGMGGGIGGGMMGSDFHAGDGGAAPSAQPTSPVDGYGLSPAGEVSGAVPLPTIRETSPRRPLATRSTRTKALGMSNAEQGAAVPLATSEARRGRAWFRGQNNSNVVVLGGEAALPSGEPATVPSVALRQLQKEIADTSQQVTEIAQQLGELRPAHQKVRMERLVRRLGDLQQEYKTLERQQAGFGRGAGQGGDQYSRIEENPFVVTQGAAAVSTFSIDVDTASYTNTRQYLMAQGMVPPPDAVRIEEFVNYFDYDYSPPSDDTPFAASIEVAGCPWQPQHRLVRIGIKGQVIDRSERPSSNLVFLVDVSGSMDDPSKLPLVVTGLKELTQQLGEHDKVAIAVYANQEGLVLSSTRGDQKHVILAALGQLKAGGSTAGGAGIQLAYRVAEDNLISGGTNRVILCTDGDFNVGVTSTSALERMAEQKAQGGVFLTVLGFGRGNLNDSMMEGISNKGNGNYHYVDTETEARKVLVREMSGTLVTIAKDVKIQVEFNPAKVAGYRLLGYENRMLAREDFNDDTKDAGEIGAGHTVTALYEVVPAGTAVAVGSVDPLKYQQAATGAEHVATAEFEDEMLELRIRYKQPEANTSQLLKFPVTDEAKRFASASEDFRFAASVAGFGLLLRDSQYKGDANVEAILEIAASSAKRDEFGYRREFVELIQRAKELGLR